MNTPQPDPTQKAEERCPLCKSPDRARRGRALTGANTSPIYGDCPDPWHSTPTEFQAELAPSSDQSGGKWAREKEAHKAGERIQCRPLSTEGGGRWIDCVPPAPQWKDDFEYRIHPDDLTPAVSGKLMTLEQAREAALDYYRKVEMARAKRLDQEAKESEAASGEKPRRFKIGTQVRIPAEKRTAYVIDWGKYPLVQVGDSFDKERGCWYEEDELEPAPPPPTDKGEAKSAGEAASHRERLGRRVREVWIAWAKQQHNCKPSWLVPYDELSEPDKEVDRRIGCAVWGDCVEEYSEAISSYAAVSWSQRGEGKVPSVEEIEERLGQVKNVHSNTLHLIVLTVRDIILASLAPVEKQEKSQPRPSISAMLATYTRALHKGSFEAMRAVAELCSTDVQPAKEKPQGWPTMAQLKEAFGKPVRDSGSEILITKRGEEGLQAVSDLCLAAVPEVVEAAKVEGFENGKSAQAIMTGRALDKVIEEKREEMRVKINEWKQRAESAESRLQEAVAAKEEAFRQGGISASNEITSLRQQLSTAIRERDEAREKIARIIEPSVDSGSLRGMKISYRDDENRFYAYDENGKFLWSGPATFNVWKCVKLTEARDTLKAEVERISNEAWAKQCEYNKLYTSFTDAKREADALRQELERGKWQPISNPPQPEHGEHYKGVGHDCVQFANEHGSWIAKRTHPDTFDKTPPTHWRVIGLRDLPTQPPSDDKDRAEMVPWDNTSDIPKNGSVWIRSKGDYREHLIIGFAHPCAFITASCGCKPVLQDNHVSDWNMKQCEYSLDRKTWMPCHKAARKEPKP